MLTVRHILLNNTTLYLWTYCICVFVCKWIKRRWNKTKWKQPVWNRCSGRCFLNALILNKIFNFIQLVSSEQLQHFDPFMNNYWQKHERKITYTLSDLLISIITLSHLLAKSKKSWNVFTAFKAAFISIRNQPASCLVSVSLLSSFLLFLSLAHVRVFDPLIVAEELKECGFDKILDRSKANLELYIVGVLASGTSFTMVPLLKTFF